ncbi:MAG: tetratricopeptide repeat protein [Elusimicrobia bacterium]|nr:tetratricopeptide repeat protein [Elusimicrobiota bacterium]
MKKIISAVLISAMAALLPAFAFRTDKAIEEIERLRQTGQYEKAIQRLDSYLLRRLSKRSARAAYWTMGDCYKKLGRMDKALGVYQLAIKLHPKDRALLLAYGQLLVDAGLFNRAKSLFERVLRRRPHDVEANLGLGRVYDGLGLSGKAAGCYQIAVSRGKVSASVHRRLSRALAGDNQYAAAEQAVLKAVEISPEADAWRDLAVFQQRQGRWEEALLSLGRAVALEPERKDLLLRRALWLQKTGKTEESAAAAREILKNHPRNPLASWILALTDFKKGDAAASLENLESAASQKDAPYLARYAGSMKQWIAENSGRLP